MPQPKPDDAPRPSWRDLYPVHPCAAVFPMMEDAALDQLAADIKVHGLQQPVVLWRAPSVPRKTQTYLVLDGRNRLEALTRLDITIPSPEDPREMIEFPGGQFACVFIVANSSGQSGAPQVHDPAEFVIGANIRRRHLTKEQQAELIVKTIAASNPADRATVARSVARANRGRLKGSTKDPILAKAVTEAAKHGISKRTVQNARAKINGKTPAPRKKTTIGVSSTPPVNEAAPLGSPPTKRVMTPSGHRVEPQDLKIIVVGWTHRLTDLELDMREAVGFWDYVEEVPGIAAKFRRAVEQLTDTTKRLLSDKSGTNGSREAV